MGLSLLSVLILLLTLSLLVWSTCNPLKVLLPDEARGAESSASGFPALYYRDPMLAPVEEHDTILAENQRRAYEHIAALEQAVSDVRADHKAMFWFLFANLLTVLISLALYIATHRSNRAVIRD